MRPDDFDFLAKLLKERSGLVVTPDKGYLLESRLMPLARTRNLKGIEEIVAKLRARDEGLARDVTEAMTTNESFFFRDQKPFDQFRDIVLPQMMAARSGKKSIRIWSAACSSGQEAYSLAMLLKEQANKLAGWHVEIVGTDLSIEMLEKAKAGLYSQFEVQRGLPIQMLVKYFKKKEESWQIDAALRGMVQFREWNLLKDLRGLGQFDIVFCRNVLIYFDQPTKAAVLDSIAKQMPEDGFLYLGGAETVLGISDRFKPMAGQRGIYCLNHDGPSTGFPVKPLA
ncbi:MAG: protein-glutamate O-methyltransferase [Telmatospirillum sp.]|nr:protein-glutamate O-methyltransferase [Telmatospirillum sp.]